MISKIIAGDVFSSKLQPGESPNKSLDIIAGTNQVGRNTRGVVHEIGQIYHRDFLNLLEESEYSEVPLGHVFSRE